MSTIKLFLTEVDNHHDHHLFGKRLRNYIMAQALFFDRLLVGDSQINNNKFLRNLLWDKEPNKLVQSGLKQDLSILLRYGYLLPVLRQDYDSLESVRQEHENRKIKDVPSKEYVEFLEQNIGSQRETYDGKLVSEVFKKRCIDAFTSPNNFGNGKISFQKQKAIIDYLSKQDVLLFGSIREWAEKEKNNGNFSQRDYYLMDRIVSGCYRHNVPLALDVNYDVPLAESRDPNPLSIEFGDKPERLRIELFNQSVEYEVPPAIFLSPKFLSLIPSESLIYIKGDKSGNQKPLDSYLKIIQCLEKIRSGKSIPITDFVNDLCHFIIETDHVVSDHLTKKDNQSYLERKRQAKNKARVKVLKGGLFEAVAIKFPWLSTIHAVFGWADEIREASKQENYLQGYMNGKSSIRERLLLELRMGKK